MQHHGMKKETNHKTRLKSCVSGSVSLEKKSIYNRKLNLHLRIVVFWLVNTSSNNNKTNHDM